MRVPRNVWLQILSSEIVVSCLNQSKIVWIGQPILLDCCIISLHTLHLNDTNPVKTFIRKSMHSEFFRFLLVGVSNTLVAYVVYLLLLPFLPYLFAYTLSYCVAVVNSYFMNVLFVFRKKVSLHSFLKFPFVYLAQYFLGVSILWLLVGQLGLAPAWAMIVVIIVTVPVTFLASSFVLKK